MMREKIILDTDIGDDIDDALALVLAANSPELELIGVTTVFRNVELRAKLAIHLLKKLNKSIPVVPGIGHPMQDKPVSTLFKHVNVNEKPGQYSSDMDREEITYHGNAIQFLKETLSASDEPITLLPVGPLTNIAVFLLEYPQLKHKIKRIVLMGGAFNMNMTEYNIMCDPEAAKVVFESGLDIIGVGLDVTGKCQLTLDEVNQIKNGQTAVSQLLSTLIERFMGYAKHLPYLHDPLAVAVAIDPSIVTMERKRIVVETQGEYTRGMTFNLSNTRWWEKDYNDYMITICTAVNRDKLVKLFLNRLIIE